MNIKWVYKRTKLTSRWIKSKNRWWIITVLIILLIMSIAPEFRAQEMSDYQENTHIMYRVIEGDPSLTFLFIHGLGENLRTWKKMEEQLTIPYQILLIDLPGHGQSSLQRRTNYSHDNLSQLLWKFVDKIGTGDLVIVGHSLGGNIALRMAAIRPEKIQGLFLLSPSVFDTRGFPLPRLITNNIFLRPLLDVMIRRIVRSPERLTKLLQQAVFDETAVDGDLIERIVTPITDNPKSYLTLIYLFRNSSRNRKLPDFGGIHVPVLIINGTEDLWVKPEDTLRLASLLPDGKLILLPSCGHMPQEEKPNEVVQKLEEFVKNLKEK